MAAFVRTSFTNNYRNIPPDSRQLILEAQTGGSEDSRKSLNQVLRQPDFIITGTTDTNTAVLNAGAAQSYCMKLVAEGGVQFPNGFDRDIDILCYSKDTATNFQYFRQTVRGGATNPTLVNGVRNLGPTVGGRCTFANSGTDIVAADAWGGFSVTLDETATGRFAAAIPKARRVLVKALNVQVVGTGSLAAAVAHAHLNALNLATGVIEIGTRLGDAATSLAPADTMQLAAEFDVLPIESPELVIETGATPDEVLVGALGQSAVAVTWSVYVYVGPLRTS